MQFDGGDDTTLNYDVRLLGRKGVLSMNAVGTISNLSDIQAHIPDILKIASFISKEKAHTIALMEEDERVAYLKENDCYDNYIFNMNLISFEFIPDKYIKEFKKTVKFIIK